MEFSRILPSKQLAYSSSIEMPHIASIAYKPAESEAQPADRYSRVSVARAELIAGHGIAGDTMGGARDRHLNIMRSELIAELRSEGFHTATGELGEQIVIAGLAPDAWRPGARLQLGDSAVVELLKLRKGCPRFVHIQGQPLELSAGRIGFMARVIEGGRIAVGSTVQPVQTADRNV
jgi:MOSC domain-containing protein YiiM